MVLLLCANVVLVLGNAGVFLISDNKTIDEQKKPALMMKGAMIVFCIVAVCVSAHKM